MIGPNAGLGHNSIIVMMEAELRYLAGALEHIRATDTVLGLASETMTK